jgi:hypothetical protein
LLLRACVRHARQHATRRAVTESWERRGGDEAHRRDFGETGLLELMMYAEQEL